MSRYMNRKLIFGFVATLVAVLLLTTSVTFAKEKPTPDSNLMNKEVLVAQNSLGGASKNREVTAAVNPAKVSKLFTRATQGGPVPQNLSGDGFTYRHDWGDRNGFWVLNLNWGAINRNSRVFVSIGECDPRGGKFIGGARYLLYNVAPNDGVVSIRVNVDWSSAIRLCADYLVVNP
jgi:hypothetical protein